MAKAYPASGDPSGEDAKNEAIDRKAANEILLYKFYEENYQYYLSIAKFANAKKVEISHSLADILTIAFSKGPAIYIKLAKSFDLPVSMRVKYKMALYEKSDMSGKEILDIADLMDATEEGFEILKLILWRFTGDEAVSMDMSEYNAYELFSFPDHSNDDYLDNQERFRMKGDDDEEDY